MIGSFRGFLKGQYFPMVSDPSQPAAPEAEANEHPADDSSTPSQNPAFGWNAYAEKLNGRFAMVGFAALLVLELLTRQDFFTWLGF